jgi:hypothetical protein
MVLATQTMSWLMLIRREKEVVVVTVVVLKTISCL